MRRKVSWWRRPWLWFQSRLGVKLFVSYLAVVLVGSFTLWLASQWVAPSAFERHVADMVTMMRRMMGPGMMDDHMPMQDMEGDLFLRFRQALNEALWWATLVAVLTAIGASWFVTRQVVTPIQAISRASQRITQGHYHERVIVPGLVSEGVLDELGELAWNFNRMAEQLARVEEARRQWLADLSHEMRTPLASIRAYIEGLLDGVLPPEPHIFAQVLREVQRLERFIDDLREVSRLEAGALDLRLTPVAPQELVDEALNRFRPAYQEKGVALHAEVDPRTPRVQVDRERFLQVLSNLLDNALRYTPEGGRVTLRVFPEGRRWVRFEVQDTGIGIPPEHLPHIFKRFYRVEPSRSRGHGGSGLGLTIVRLLVEAHGGQVWAESPGPGQGSTFIVRLPAVGAGS